MPTATADLFLSLVHAFLLSHFVAGLLPDINYVDAAVLQRPRHKGLGVY